MKVLFVGKAGDEFAQKAAEITTELFTDAKIIWGDRSLEFPKELFDWEGDYIFSYLSPWIIPERVLTRARFSSINWHPGPPEYPGIGCTNFAIYNQEKVFGITCHHMLSKVDTGKIIQVKRFNIDPDHSVLDITLKCYELIFESFKEIINLLLSDKELTESKEMWQREPYKRSQLDALCELTLDMASDEIKRRIKATTYHKPWAYFNIDGEKYYLSQKNLN